MRYLLLLLASVFAVQMSSDHALAFGRKKKEVEAPTDAKPAEEAGPVLLQTGLYLAEPEAKKNEDTRDPSHEMYIRSVGDNANKKYFAFIKWSSGFLTSMYEVQVTATGDLTFFPITQDKNFKFAVDYATPIYTVQQDLRQAKRELPLKWTPHASTFGSTIHCSITPTFKFAGNKRVWGDFDTLKANTVLSLKGKRNREKNLTVDPAQPDAKPNRNLFVNITRSATDSTEYFIKTDNFWFETRNHESFENKNVRRQQAAMSYKPAAKTFGSIEDIPGVLLAREKTGDAIVGIGGDIASEVSYLIVPISNADNEVKRIHTVRMAPGVTECGYMSVGLDVR